MAHRWNRCFSIYCLRRRNVTIGLSRLQQVLRSLSPAFENELEQWQHGRRALLVPARGEQHTFGLFMLEEFFRRSGWDVWGGCATSTKDLVAIVRSEHIDIVGFSLSCDGSLEQLAVDIKAVRKASRNKAVGIMVGGPAFIGHPERVDLVGADATASDGRQAVAYAQKFLTAPAPR
jgi:MerR family transcriptional regulator, light-induced transcriptional regulator